MMHLVILPVLVPLLAAAVALALGTGRLVAQRVIGIVATLAQLGIAIALAGLAASGAPIVYPLGDWPAPFGIVLVLDRLAAMMLVLTGVIALVALWSATGRWDDRGKHFHALFQFQLMGLAGAFLTGDLFNLFVFFEVMLIASYCLLLHGHGRARTSAAIHYVVINLTASALFLLAAALLYAMTGTLNMADLALRLGALAPADQPIAAAGGLLLFIVFATKAAIVPLHFWLPSAYTSACAPVAALFAMMTKVGVYSIVRVHTLSFGPDAGATANLAGPWLLPAAVLTGVIAAVGALGARDLRVLIAYLSIASIGTLLAGLSVPTSDALAASLYYLAHSTLVGAGLFLLAEGIGASRSEAGTRLVPAAPGASPWLLGTLLLLLGAAAAGLPPFSGFIGKVLILETTWNTAITAWVWSVVLAIGLASLVALARAGSTLFWNTLPPTATRKDRLRGNPSEKSEPDAGASANDSLGPTLALFGASLLLAVAAGPAKHFADATARQLLDRDAYISGVLGPDARSRPSTRPLPEAPR